MPCHEGHGFTKRDDGTIERSYIVYGVQDDAQALAMAQAEAPPDIRPTPQAFPTHTRGPGDGALKQMGFDLYEVVFVYTPLVAGDVGGGPSDLELALDGVVTFDATGQSLHITQALSQTAYGPLNCSDLEKARVIGANGDSVEGVDSLVPKLTFSITKIPPVGKLLSLNQYVIDVARLVGKTNAYPYTLRGWLINRLVAIEFQAGELMFMGASPQAGFTPGGVGRFKYDLDASENRKNITVSEYNDGNQPLKIADKKGHQIVWTLYKQKEISNPPMKIGIPKAALVATIAYDEDFQAILGF